MIVINPKNEQPVSGTVISSSGATYRVRTGSGRILTATATATWTVGTSVTVLGGVIIGAAGRQKTAKIYQV